MDKLRLCAPTLFGLEGIAGDELKRLGMKNVAVENGRVYFDGDAADMAKANVCLRTAERVLVTLGTFKALTFDNLFEGVKAIEWEKYISKDGKFPVKGHSLDSQLKSIPDCQAIIKKAVADRLGHAHRMPRMPETGALYQIRFSLMNDVATIYLDSSGVGLHKRGYRELSTEAPLKETLAAGMVILSRYRGRGEFIDPFCGSGTIPIEAALIAKNRAPGMLRTFGFDEWFWAKDLSAAAKEEAKGREFDGDYSIEGLDIDHEAIQLAAENAKKAGVDTICKFSQADVASLSPTSERGTIVTNPPYGIRLLDIQEAQKLYRTLGGVTSEHTSWGIYVLSADPEFERFFGRKSTKKRKLYNGMIKCDLFMYFNR